MTFLHPAWLILFIPVVLLFWLARMPTRGLTILRASIIVLVLLALAGLSLQLPSREGVVVVVADRSLSMPITSQTEQEEIAHLLYRSMRSEDELAVVAFGQRAIVEQPPLKQRFGGFQADVGREGSHLGNAIDRALSLIPPNRPGRILVLSDGNSTGDDLEAAAARAGSAGIAIDFRPMHRAQAGDLAIGQIDAPSSVAAAEAFIISAWVTSPHAQEIAYELQSGDQIIASGKANVSQGRTRLLFRDKAGDAGTREYTLRVGALTGEDNDPIKENNKARFLIGVRGNKPLLCLSPPGSRLAELLAAGGIKVARKTPEECRWTLAELSAYSGVLLENTLSNKIGVPGMESLAAWVSDAGGGLFMTGGRQSYGSGGYFKSPLEPILPVSMELRREHRKLSLAVVVALDRSGSMAVTVPGGRTKMQLADIATVELLNQMSGSDQFGCLAVDSAAHEIVPLSDLTEREAIAQKVLKIDSMGGGIFVYEALEKAAAMIAPATAGTKHIILFSDAADSEEPGNYKELLEKCLEAGITVSVIGLGTDRDSDADLLKDIAARGGGQCTFTEDPHDLPRLFAQDLFLVARSTFIEEPTPVRATAGMSVITPQNWGTVPDVGGYNLCYLRPGANMGIVTEDEYAAPLVASWQAGTGRVLSYTGVADGTETGPIGNWPQAGEFMTSLARWVSAQDQELGPDLLLTQELRGGVCRVLLHLDGERASTPFQSVPQITVLRGQDGRKPEAERVPLQWVTADLLSVDVPVYGSETVLNTLDLPGVGRTTLPPICLPYSAEYAPQADGEGKRNLERLAKVTGGVERIQLDGLWNDLPRKPRTVSLAPWLLIAALCLLLLEILQRRTGLLSFRRKPAFAGMDDASAGASPGSRKQFRGFRKSSDAKSKSAAASKGTVPGTTSTPPPSASPASSPAKPSEDTVGDALAQARQRAARRTQR